MATTDLGGQAETLKDTINKLRATENPDLALRLAKRIVKGLTALQRHDSELVAGVIAQSPADWLDHVEALLCLVQEQHDLQRLSGR